MGIYVILQLQTKMKRRAVGIWHCGSCRKTVAGGAWTYKYVYFTVFTVSAFQFHEKTCSNSIIIIYLVLVNSLAYLLHSDVLTAVLGFKMLYIQFYLTALNLLCSLQRFPIFSPYRARLQL